MRSVRRMLAEGTSTQREWKWYRGVYEKALRRNVIKVCILIQAENVALAVWRKIMLIYLARTAKGNKTEKGINYWGSI